MSETAIHAICTKCGRQIGSVSIITSDRKIYHPECNPFTTPTTSDIDALIEQARLAETEIAAHGGYDNHARTIADLATALQRMRDSDKEWGRLHQLVILERADALNKLEAAEARIKVLEEIIRDAHPYLENLVGYSKLNTKYFGSENGFVPAKLADVERRARTALEAK